MPHNKLSTQCASPHNYDADLPDYCRKLTVRDANGVLKDLIFPKSLDLDRPKRARTTFSTEQLNHLEQAFLKNQYLVGRERSDLADELKLSETQVKVWFQNRRTKHKRDQGKPADESTDRITKSESSPPIGCLRMGLPTAQTTSPSNNATNSFLHLFNFDQSPNPQNSNSLSQPSSAICNAANDCIGMDSYTPHMGFPLSANYSSTYNPPGFCFPTKPSHPMVFGHHASTGSFGPPDINGQARMLSAALQHHLASQLNGMR